MNKRITTAVLCLMIPFLPVYANNFSDVPDGHWAKPYISACADAGILRGYEDGTFRPDGQLTVGEYIKMLCCTDVPAFRFYDPVTAVGEGAAHWAAPYLERERVVQENVIPVYEDAQKNVDYLDKPVSRLEMARFSANSFAAASGISVQGHNVGMVEFTDTAGLADADKQYIAYCVDKGLIAGFEDGSFRPDEILSRDQAAKVASLIDAKAWETRADLMTEEFGPQASANALELERVYGLRIARGERLIDEDSAAAVKALLDYCNGLPSALPRSLAAALGESGKAMTIDPPESASDMSAYCANTFNFLFSSNVLASVLEAHYPELLDAYGLAGDDIYLFSLLLTHDSAELKDAAKLEKCALVYQILQQIWRIPEDEMKKIEFFPNGYQFQSAVDVSPYYVK